MRIDIRATNIELPRAVCIEGRRRTLYALNRFAPQIRGVSIVLTDINGPRGGEGTSCLVRIKGAKSWCITVSDIDHDAGRALTYAIARAARAVVREVERSSDVRVARRGRRAS